MLFTFADRLDVTLIILGTVCAVANGLTHPLMTVIFAKLINTFGTTHPFHIVHQVSKVALLFLYLAVGSGIASFLRERQAARIRSLYLRTILKQDIAFFDTETTTGEVTERMCGDTILIQDAVGEKDLNSDSNIASLACLTALSTEFTLRDKVGKFIQLASTFVGGFVIAFIKGWRLSIVLLPCLPCIIIAGSVLSMMMSKLSIRGQIAYAKAGNVVDQTVGAIRTVRSFTGEKKAIEMYNTNLKDAYNAMVQQELAAGLGLGVFLFAFFSTYGLAMWYGSKLIIENGYNGGIVIGIIMALLTGGMSLGQTSPSLNAFAAGQVAAYKMFETIKRKPKIDAYDTGGIVLDEIKGDIELHDVYFSYPARPDVKIFVGFSLYVPSGTTAALVGQSGSGKSIVISLIERFYDPDGGAVHIDGINLKDFQVRWIREQIGLVDQEPVLFGGSIKENIAYGREGATDEEITTAITLSNAKTFINKLPQVYINNNYQNFVTQKSKSYCFRFLSFPEVPFLLVGSIGAAVHGVVFPMYGLLVSSAISIFFKSPEQLRKVSIFWSLLFVGLGFVILAATPLMRYFFGIAGGKLIERIRSLTFEKVVHQEISWFDDPANSSGAVGARLSTDASTVRSLVGNTLSLIVQNIATITAGLVIAFTANWILAFIVLALTPLFIMQGLIQIKFLRGFSTDAKVKYEEASQVANDAIGSIRTVAAFCAESKVMGMYRKKCEAPEKQGVRSGLVSGAGFRFSFLALYCSNALCFYIGSILVQHGKATFSEVFKVFFSLTMTAMTVSNSSSLAPDTNKAKDSAASIFEILDSKPVIDSSSTEGMTLETVAGDIELRHVSFHYPTRPHIQIFKDLCLNIPAGKTVALVGESGCGKSTVISLLERFYNPDSGEILKDEVDIKKFRLSWLRQQMGLVGQEPILFNESIRANIAYGKEEGATEEEIVAAANAHEFISSLPSGYDTSVGERGTQLSGGQKQRIAIARAKLKDPKILLLDEATSALDEESQHIVQDALDRVSVSRTTVVVAHRLTTIRGADIIAVMKNGVVAEKGRHDVLIKINDGVYASMVALHMSASLVETMFLLNNNNKMYFTKKKTI
ncbi:hypothetical protein RIF29_39225 [Crotalaria pallida]|uniref:Uncharacterized protein n=1 Tax=Crotalaria pallida TaxID=3830 RepID=A0AAN9E1B0_CROPI